MNAINIVYRDKWIQAATIGSQCKPVSEACCGSNVLARLGSSQRLHSSEAPAQQGVLDSEREFNGLQGSIQRRYNMDFYWIALSGIAYTKWTAGEDYLS